MKKIVTILIAVIVAAAVLFGIAMGVKKYKENNALATADTVYDVSDNKGTITVNEEVAKQMLSQYPLERLGYIKKPVGNYFIKLGDTTLHGVKACRVELLLSKESETPEAVFAISGYNCYVFDATKNEYLLLTLNGAFQVEASTTQEGTTLFYVEADDLKLHKIIDRYTKDDLGFAKEPSEYKMVALGTSAVAKDKKMVFPVKMYENDGTPTNYTCAICDGDVYRFDTTSRQYEKISK